jgi:hypothetical protein
VAYRNLVFFGLSYLSPPPTLLPLYHEQSTGAFSVWSLKVASMTYARVLGDLAAICSAFDVMRDVLLGTHSTRVSARAGRIPLMGMCAG